MLGAHKPLHLRQAEERRQKLLPDLVGEQTVPVLREGRGVENLFVDHKPDEPAKQHLELQPFDQLPLRAERIEKLADAKLAEAAPAGWTDARSPGKAPKTSRRAQPKPRSPAAASPATDAAPGCAPRPRHKRTRPRSSDPPPASTPASTPPNRLADATESRRKPKFQNLSAQL